MKFNENTTPRKEEEELRPDEFFLEHRLVAFFYKKKIGIICLWFYATWWQSPINHSKLHILVKSLVGFNFWWTFGSPFPLRTPLRGIVKSLWTWDDDEPFLLAKKRAFRGIFLWRLFDGECLTFRFQLAQVCRENSSDAKLTKNSRPLTNFERRQRTMQFRALAFQIHFHFFSLCDLQCSRMFRVLFRFYFHWTFCRPQKLMRDVNINWLILKALPCLAFGSRSSQT